MTICALKNPLIQKMIGGKKAVDVNVFSVPYGPDGLRTTGAKHTLDLRQGAKVMLTEGPQKGELATVTGRNADGHWRLRITHRQVSNSGSIKEFGEDCHATRHVRATCIHQDVCGLERWRWRRAAAAYGLGAASAAP